jgi:hypothetical protein
MTTPTPAPAPMPKPWPFPSFPNPLDKGHNVPKFNPSNHEDALL